MRLSRPFVIALSVLALLVTISLWDMAKNAARAADPRQNILLVVVDREVLEKDRYGVALSTFIPVKRFQSSVLNLTFGGEVFGKTRISRFSIPGSRRSTLGLLWRHKKSRRPA